MIKYHSLGPIVFLCNLTKKKIKTEQISGLFLPSDMQECVRDVTLKYITSKGLAFYEKNREK